MRLFFYNFARITSAGLGLALILLAGIGSSTTAHASETTTTIRLGTLLPSGHGPTSNVAGARRGLEKTLQRFGQIDSFP